MIKLLMEKQKKKRMALIACVLCVLGTAGLSAYALGEDELTVYPVRTQGYVNIVAEKAQRERQAAQRETQAFAITLRPGMTGLAVQVLNERLLELGYLSHPQGREFTSQTLLAIKEFQSENGLKADGVVGRLTFEELMPAA